MALSAEQRAVLVALLLKANRVVPDVEVAARLPSGDVPGAVAGLRDAVGGELVRDVDGGRVLAVGDVGPLWDLALREVFAGRDGEVRELARLVLDGGSVVVSGGAGIGKSALVDRVVEVVREHFPDGVVRVGPRGELSGARLRALGDSRRRVLVVLDGVRGSAPVRAVLAGGVPVLATSRDELPDLPVRGFRVGPLDDSGAEAVLTAVAGGAVRGAAELLEVCGGVPLALRVAGGVLGGAPAPGGQGWFEPEARSPVGDVVARAEAVVGAGAWAAFRLLSLVPGPDFTPSAAAALVGESREAASARLELLATAGLLERSSPGRYRFHDLVRAHAVDRVEGTGEAELGRLVGFYRDAAGRAADAFAPGAPRPGFPERTAALPRFADAELAGRWFAAERENLVAAALVAGAPDSWRLGCAVAGFLVARGHGAEALAVCSAGVADARAAGDADGEAAALVALGRARAGTGDRAGAREAFGGAVAVSRPQGLVVWELEALLGLGAVLGDGAEGAARVAEAVELARRTGSARGAGRAP
ncbi:AAA ATPase domain [Actinosynnema pretiosum]|nr:AAA ATPase domain [Actinosynnema pretiosum]